jgi:hypothetical protein
LLITANFRPYMHRKTSETIEICKARQIIEKLGGAN